MCKGRGVHGRVLLMTSAFSVSAPVQRDPDPQPGCASAGTEGPSGAVEKAFGAEEVVSALHTFLGFSLPQAPPWSEEPVMLTGPVPS